MKPKHYHMIAVVLLGTGAIYGTYRVVARKMDREAAKFIVKLEAQQVPSGDQMEENSGFDTGFAYRMREKYGNKLIQLKQHAAEQLAIKIANAWNWWGDSEKEVLSVFRSINDKVQLSQVAEAYQAEVGVSLLDDLLDRLENTPDTLAKVIALSGALPPKRLA